MKDVVGNTLETRDCTVSDQNPVVNGTNVKTLIKRTRTLRAVVVVLLLLLLLHVAMVTDHPVYDISETMEILL